MFQRMQHATTRNFSQHELQSWNMWSVFIKQKKIIWRVKKLFALLIIVGCNTPMPKPKGMLAMNYPPPVYQKANTDCPFTFDFNSLSSIKVQSNCFFSVSYPSMKAKVYMSYFNLNEEAFFMLKIYELFKELQKFYKSRPSRNLQLYMFSNDIGLKSKTHFLNCKK